MHEGIPKSFWEKESVGGGSEAKNSLMLGSVSETVIVKDSPEKESLYLEVQEVPSVIEQSHLREEREWLSVAEREIRVRELMLEMDKEVKQVRKKYMAKMRAFYCVAEKENATQGMNLDVGCSRGRFGKRSMGSVGDTAG